MSRRKKPPQTVDDPPALSQEQVRETQTVTSFFTLLCGFFFLCGVGAAGNAASRPGEAVNAVVAVLYAIGGLGGTIGMIAAGRGSRRWSRLVYLLALGFPFLTTAAGAAHVVRLRQLEAFEQTRREKVGPGTRVTDFGGSGARRPS